MKTFPTLYARNSNGKINQWEVFAEDDGTVVVQEGLTDGVLTITKRKSKGKNIGKMNETTAFQQACKDAESRWENKRKKGYKSLEDLSIETLPNGQGYRYNGKLYDIGGFIDEIIDQALPKSRTDANNLSKPMKAQPYFNDKGLPRIGFPCIGQPKLNGFRVIARLEKIKEGEGIFATDVIKPTFRSKEGLRYTVLEHIEPEVEIMITALSSMLHIPPSEIALDGEIYCHNLKLQEIASAVKKRNSNTERLQFHVFDLAIEGRKQKERSKVLMMQPDSDYTYIKIVDHCDIADDSHAQRMTDGWIKIGYEGGIFRDPKAIYQFGSRPKTMVKLKRCLDQDFTIIDVVGGDNAPDLGILVCRTKEGKVFKVNPDANHEERRQMLRNKEKYIGKLVQLKFYEFTKDNIPFHIKECVVRDYE